MLKKRVLPVLLALVLLFGIPAAAMAVAPITEDPQASYYFNDYAIAIGTSSGQILVTVSVGATHVMTRVGVQQLVIKQYVGGRWEEFTTVYGITNPSACYDYNSIDYLHTFYFNCLTGVQYKATATLLAVDSNGSETRSITSPAQLCT